MAWCHCPSGSSCRTARSSGGCRPRSGRSRGCVSCGSTTTSSQASCRRASSACRGCSTSPSARTGSKARGRADCARRETHERIGHITHESSTRARARIVIARPRDRHRVIARARRQWSFDVRCPPPPSSPLGRSVSAAPLVAIVSCAVLRRGRWWSSSRSPRGLTVTARAVRETHVSGSSHENACDWFIVSFSLFSGEALPLPNPPRARSLVLAYNSNDHATVSPTCVCATM